MKASGLYYVLKTLHKINTDDTDNATSLCLGSIGIVIFMSCEANFHVARREYYPLCTFMFSLGILFARFLSILRPAAYSFAVVAPPASTGCLPNKAGSRWCLICFP